MPESAFDGLRSLILAADPAALSLAPTTGLPRVWAVLMEMGYEKATVSLVAVADGTTSLYFSNGGGIIGGGEHDPVRAAARWFLETIEQTLDELAPTLELPVPGRGRVRFNVLTFNGRWTAEALEDDLGNGRHALSTAFHAGHAVITELRLIDEHAGRRRD
jgi:hypothetical protein